MQSRPSPCDRAEWIQLPLHDTIWSSCLFPLPQSGPLYLVQFPQSAQCLDPILGIATMLKMATIESHTFRSETVRLK